MKELNDIVVTKTAEMIEDGTIEKMIEERLKKTIAECVDESMRCWSGFGKAIKGKIEASVMTANEDIKIPAYNQFIQKVVNEQFIKVLDENAVKHLTELIENVIEPVTKQAKFSNLLNQIEEHWGDTAREEGKDEIEIETSGNEEGTALYVTLKHPNFSHDDIKVTFYNHNSDEEDLWHIGYIRKNGYRITGAPINKAVTYTGGVCDLLYKYYAMETKFEMDTELESICVADY